MASTEPDSPDVAALEVALGHRFADRALLHRALTHRSAAEDDAGAYERLEFLGDRVLALSVCDLLMPAYPGESEGALSKRLHHLVSRDMLAEVAREVGVGPYIRLGVAEVEGAQRDNPAILSDVVEALIAALYRDGGMAAAHRFIETHWRARIAAETNPPKDPKSTLQEWAMARGLALPVYREVGREGPDHAPRFIVSVTVGRHPPVEAEGASKRAAEREAAAGLLERLEGS